MNTTVGAPFCPNHWTQHKPTRWEQRQINQAVVRVVRLNTLLRLAHHEGHEGTRSAIVMRAAEEAQLDRFAKMARLKRRDDEYRRLGFLLVVTFALMDWQELARTWQKAVNAPRSPDLSEMLLNIGTFDAYGQLDRGDGDKPNYAALIISMNTADLATVMKFINRRMRWFEGALKHAGVDPKTFESIAQEDHHD